MELAVLAFFQTINNVLIISFLSFAFAWHYSILKKLIQFSFRVLLSNHHSYFICIVEIHAILVWLSHNIFDSNKPDVHTLIQEWLISIEWVFLESALKILSWYIRFRFPRVHWILCKLFTKCRSFEACIYLFHWVHTLFIYLWPTYFLVVQYELILFDH